MGNGTERKDRGGNNKSVTTKEANTEGQAKKKQGQKQKIGTRSSTFISKRVRNLFTPPETVALYRFSLSIVSNSCQSCDHNLLQLYRYI